MSILHHATREVTHLQLVNCVLGADALTYTVAAGL